MSDDLISRKALIGTERLLMTDIVQNNPTAKYILEQVLFDIENAPAAFDKKKVIEELKNLKDSLIDCKDLCDECIEIECDQCALKKAIKIVEKGGIE